MRSLRIRLSLLLLAAAFAWSGCSNDRSSQPLGPESTGFEAGDDTGTKYAIPAGYYDSVDTSNPTVFRATLHAVIDDHLRYPYTSSSTDTWDILEMASEDPSNTNNILDVYKNASYAKQGGGNTFYNREHTWPKSYGFPDDGSSNYPYTDCHQRRQLQHLAQQQAISRLRQRLLGKADRRQQWRRWRDGILPRQFELDERLAHRRHLGSME